MQLLQLAGIAAQPVLDHVAQQLGPARRAPIQPPLRQIEDDPRGMDYLEVTLGADGAGMFVRQILNQKLKAEGCKLSGGRAG